jgi:hypothetical protein
MAYLPEHENSPGEYLPGLLYSAILVSRQIFLYDVGTEPPAGVYGNTVRGSPVAYILGCGSAASNLGLAGPAGFSGFAGTVDVLLQAFAKLAGISVGEVDLIRDPVQRKVDRGIRIRAIQVID